MDSRKGGDNRKENSRGIDKGNDKERIQRPRTKHLLHVHQYQNDRDEGDKEIRGPVIPFVKTRSRLSRRSIHVSIQRKVIGTRQLRHRIQ